MNGFAQCLLVFAGGVEFLFRFALAVLLTVMMVAFIFLEMDVEDFFDLLYPAAWKLLERQKP